MKLIKIIVEGVLVNVVKEIPVMFLTVIRFTLIILWASTSIILIWESVTGESKLNYLCAAAVWGLFFLYSFALLKLCIAILLSVPKTLKLGLVISLTFFGIYSLYIIYTLHYAVTVPWSCIPMFRDTTADTQIKFNLGAMTATGTALIVSNLSLKNTGFLKS